MEETVLEYEAFIEKASCKPSKELAQYHAEMVANFQHERSIHLAVTLFFVALALVMLGLSAWLTTVVVWTILIPFYLITAILVGMSIAYVSHYYFLENHIQGLYKYNRILHNCAK